METKNQIKMSDLTIEDEASPAGNAATIYYEALAKDAQGNKYLVKWDLIVDENDYKTLTDESCACDWDNPYEITLIEVA